MVIKFPKEEWEKFKKEVDTVVRGQAKLDQSLVIFLFNLYRQLKFDSFEQFSPVLNHLKRMNIDFFCEDQFRKDKEIEKIAKDSLNKIKEEIQKDGLVKVGEKEESFWEEEETTAGMIYRWHLVEELLLKEKIPAGSKLFEKIMTATAVLERLARFARKKWLERKDKKK